MIIIIYKNILSSCIRKYVLRLYKKSNCLIQVLSSVAGLLYMKKEC